MTSSISSIRATYSAHVVVLGNELVHPLLVLRRLRRDLLLVDVALASLEATRTRASAAFGEVGSE